MLVPVRPAVALINSQRPPLACCCGPRRVGVVPQEIFALQGEWRPTCCAVKQRGGHRVYIHWWLTGYCRCNC